MLLLKKSFPLRLNASFEVIIHHIFRSLWEAPIGSVLMAKHEDDPQSLIHDKFAIALVNDDSTTVGHIPKFMSKLAYFFNKHGGHIKCEITGVQKYSKDLEQGGLEIPARMTFSNTNERMTEVMKEKLDPLIKGYKNINLKTK